MPRSPLNVKHVPKQVKTSGTKRIDLAWIERLRKDFLTLLKNLPRVKDYKIAHELRQALGIYRRDFEDLFFERFLNKDLKYSMGLDKDTVGWISSKLRSVAWAFATELSSMPIGFSDDYWNESQLFARFEREAPKWKNRLQHKARVFWNALKDILDWYSAQGKPGFDVKVPEKEQVQLEGFQLVMKGYDPTDKYNVSALEVIKDGLKKYRSRASATFPWLLKNQLPVIIEFEATLDKGGTYNHNGTITVYASSLSKGPDWFVHVMAHEMGHHLWRHLDAKAAEFWSLAIRGDYGDLDIQEVIDKWPGDAWAFQFPEVMGDKDPILALQVDGVSRGTVGELQKKEHFQSLLDAGTKILSVPKTPITGYSTKSPEEALCEAIGLLVAYGPRAVHETVRGWLSVVLPGKIKLAQRIAARFLASQN